MMLAVSSVEPGMMTSLPLNQPEKGKPHELAWNIEGNNRILSCSLIPNVSAALDARECTKVVLWL